MKKNYHKILGVNQEASVEDIKKAYRKLAMKYHPDRNNGDKHAEEKFKEINEAYEALTNPQKNFSSEQGNFHFHEDIDDFLKSHFNSAFSDFFKPRLQLDLTFWEAALGCKKVIHIDNNGLVETLTINIPPAIFDGEEINIKINNQSYSIVINVLNEHNAERHGLDILITVSIPFDVAVLGGELNFPHWDGDMKINIPAGLQPQQTLRLQGKGLARQGRKGDLFIKTEIFVPKKVNEKQKELLLQWRETDRQHSFFDKIKNFWKN